MQYLLIGICMYESFSVSLFSEVVNKFKHLWPQAACILLSSDPRPDKGCPMMEAGSLLEAPTHPQIL